MDARDAGRPTVDFLGIGAQKAATSWLHVHLASHPQIAFPGVKETHFWDERRGRPVADWLAMFDAASPGCLRGEITPAYGMLDEAVVREIARAAPGVRAFYVLRNPMERAWSAALMDLGRAGLVFAETPDAWFIEHFRSPGSRERGDYVGTLQRWRKVLGDDGLLVLWFEDICSEPRRVLVRLAEYLGIDEAFFQNLPSASLTEPIFASSGEALRDSLRPELQRLYARPIADLASCLGVDLGHWLRFERRDAA